MQVSTGRPRRSRKSPVAGMASGGPASTGPLRLRLIYRVISSPAVAEIVGDGRPWTVLMISLLSMPSR